MSFERNLRDLVFSVEGSLGAIFLDWEGETVEVACDDHPLDDLRVVGAYQGIFLGQLERLCRQLPIGRPQRFKVEFERETILSCVLRDGYYLVLLLGFSADETLAWKALDHCRSHLLAEM
jgi:predicted regulator of Ras-like GTPase activity (Roadblock/LC7/MglB family)